MAADKRPTDDDADDAWIRLPGGEMTIRVRSLTRYLEKGGRLVHARLIEDTDGLYSVWMRLADRPGEFRLNQFLHLVRLQRPMGVRDRDHPRRSLVARGHRLS